MEEQIDPDFDPTTEERQQDISDTVDDEYESLLKRPDEDEREWYERMKNRFGRGVHYAVATIKATFKINNPGQSPPLYMSTKTVRGKGYGRLDEPEEIEMEDLEDLLSRDPNIITLRKAKEDARALFPNMDDALLDFQIGKKGQVQIRDARKMGKWHDLYQKRDTKKINNQLTKEIKKALGPPNMRSRNGF